MGGFVAGKQVRPLLTVGDHVEGDRTGVDHRRLVLEARDAGFAFGDPQALAPASDIGRIRRAMSSAARRRMIVIALNLVIDVLYTVLDPRVSQK